MRKFFALALAVAMVMSLASVSFAADEFDPNSKIALSAFHKYDADKDEFKTEQAQYGKSYYAVIYEGQWVYDYNGTTVTSDDTADFEYAPITDYDQVEKLKIKTDFEMGEDLVESVSIVKKSLKVDSIDTTERPNPEYDDNDTLDVTGNAWVLTGGTAIDNGKYYSIDSGAAIKGSSIPNAAASGANGVINKYDLYTIEVTGSETGTEADPIAITSTPVGGIGSFDETTVIEDTISDTMAEVIANNDIVAASATRDAAGKWTVGAGTEYVEELVPGYYYYFVEVKTKAERVTGDADVIGTFEFNRKADSKKGIAKIDDEELDFNFNLFYEKNYNGNTAYKIDTEDGVTLKWDDLYALKFDNDDEIEIEFGTEPNEGTFTVDVSGQGKLIVDFSTKANDAIADANPGVKMNFVNFNGAKFNRVGEFEYEMENLVAAYQIVDDQLVAINGLEISSDTATFSTRTLGNYVFADAELVNPTPVVEAPAAEAPAVTNPSTGAAA